MGRVSWSLVILLLLATFESGYSFFFKRSQENDSPNKVAHLRSRYWNDDIQPCIEKYCLPYVGKKRVYIKCLEHYCPAGLLAVPRDVEDMDLSYVADLLRDTEYCREPAPETNPSADWNSDCLDGHCNNAKRLDTIEPHTDYIATFKYGVYNLCRELLCSNVRKESHYDCVRERCCGQAEDDWENSSIKRSAIDVVAPPPGAMTRKRRVLDDVSQCIQSYCSGKRSTEKLYCIVNNCHRM